MNECINELRKVYMWREWLYTYNSDKVGSSNWHVIFKSAYMYKESQEFIIVYGITQYDAQWVLVMP